MKKNVFITGATSGIGRALAQTLAGSGEYAVFAAGRNDVALQELGAIANVIPIKLDVTDDRSIDAARTIVFERTSGQPLDVLVNNAGYNHAGPILDLSREDWRAQFETNVFGVSQVIRAFAPSMAAKGSGRIINISSINGVFTYPLYGAYTASKYALESLSDALRIELEPLGVDVVIVQPGVVRTPFADQAVNTIKQRGFSGSIYRDVLSGVDDIKASFDAQAMPVEKVVKLLVEVVEATKPSARYLVPSAARLFLGLMRLLPTRTVDGMLRKQVGIARARLSLPPGNG